MNTWLEGHEFYIKELGKHVHNDLEAVILMATLYDIRSSERLFLENCINE